MSEISYAFQTESEENLSENQILGEVKTYIESEFNKVNFYDNNFSSTVKSKILNPVVKLNGNVDIRVKDKKSKIFLNVNTKTNGWFWFEVVIGFFFPAIWVLLAIQWYVQKNKSSEIFNNLRNYLDSKFSKF